MEAGGRPREEGLLVGMEQRGRGGETGLGCATNGAWKKSQASALALLMLEDCCKVL